jgi:Protein of unknown function (DUF1236)
MFVTRTELFERIKAVKPIVVAAAFTLLAAPAFAQMQTERTTTTTTTTVSPAEESQMHDSIIHEHRAPIAPPPGFDVNTGAVIPQGVELYSFPAEHHWNYEYVTFGDRTVLVDPVTRRIITVIR